MKRIFALFLIVVMCCSLTACGGSTSETPGGSQGETESSEIPEAPADSETPAVIRYDFPEDGGPLKVIYASPEHLSSCMHACFITEDNWNEYFGDYEFIREREVVKSDDSGNVVSSEIVAEQMYGFGLKWNYIGMMPDTMHLTFSGHTNESGTSIDGEIDIFAGKSRVSGIHVEDYECLRIVNGDIAVVDLGEGFAEWRNNVNYNGYEIYVGDDLVVPHGITEFGMIWSILLGVCPSV